MAEPPAPLPLAADAGEAIEVENLEADSPDAGSGRSSGSISGSGSGRSSSEYSGWVYHLGVNSIGHEYCHLRFLVIRGKCVAMYKRDPHENPGLVRFWFSILTAVVVCFPYSWISGYSLVEWMKLLFYGTRQLRIALPFVSFLLFAVVSLLRGVRVVGNYMNC
jgi:hypothetical protein